MQPKVSGITVGIGLIFLGILLLLNNFVGFDFPDEYFVAVIFGIASFFFYNHYFRDKSKWWSFVLGSVFLFLTVTLVMSGSRSIEDELIGVALFWISAGTFLWAYLQNKRQWWPLIPTGVLFTLGFIVLSEATRFHMGGVNPGFYFFIGLALTFGVLYFLKNEVRNLSWAAFPGLGCLGIALIIGLTDRYSIEGQIVAPLIFIILGLYLLVKSTLLQGKKRDNQLEVQ